VSELKIDYIATCSVSRTLSYLYKRPFAHCFTLAEKPKRSRPSHPKRSRSDSQSGQVDKKPRMIFTDEQRDVLKSIFLETPKPNKELQVWQVQEWEGSKVGRRGGCVIGY